MTVKAMAGVGVERRLAILLEAAEQQILKPLRTHGWGAKVSRTVEAGEFLVLEAAKADQVHRLALLYSSATDNKVYKQLAKEVEHIFTNGELYKIESHAYGIEVPVEPVADFFQLLLSWNKALAPLHKPSAPEDETSPPRKPSRSRHIRAENPLAGIWARLEQFRSVRLASRLVARRAADSGGTISDELVKSKAEGVAYSIRNACDYFRHSPHESLNKRVLSLYYGSLSLAFAEMLSAPTGPGDLDEVEGMTKYGHGLYVVSYGGGGFSDVTVGVLGNGFFPRWMAFLGHDTSEYPRQKAKTASDLDVVPDGMTASVAALLARVPELGDLFEEVFQAEDPMWAVPLYDQSANPNPVSRTRDASRPSSTYVTLLDPSGRLTVDRVRQLPWPFAEPQELDDRSDGVGIRVRVDHEGYEYWHGVLPIHRSPFASRSALVFPLFRTVNEYRAVGVVVLYVLSILVRYMPSIWRRIEGGDWDEHQALVEECLNVLERVLPEKFLEVILEESVYARQPGSMF